MLSEQLAGGTTTNRQFTYSYYISGANVGLLQNKLDKGRSVTNTLNYDVYLRPATSGTSGSSSDQNVTLNYQYDRRSLMTNLTQVSGVTSATTSTVQHALDGYGQVTEEQISLNGAVQSDFTQVWDAAGRRSQLNQVGAGTGGSISYWYQADGLLTQELQGGQYYQFGYDDNGLLNYRVSPWTTWVADQRDGRGRMLQQEVDTAGGSPLAETLTALFDTAHVQRSQKALIHAAAGGVGSFAVQFAKWKGAYVIATASARSSELVRKLGADEIIDYHSTRFERVVQDAEVC